MKNHYGVYLNLHVENDKPIVEKLKEQANKQGYIKGLIRKDIYIKEQYNMKKGE